MVAKSGKSMKRDMDLIRAILLAVESDEHGFVSSGIEIPGYTQEQINYHAFLLAEAGLVEAINMTFDQSQSPGARITRLTWAGHEFLDAARDNQRWNFAKDTINKAGGASLQIWILVLADLIKKKLGL